MQAASTPQPYQNDSPSYPRTTAEIELWDEHVADIFFTDAASLTFFSRIDARIIVLVQGKLAAAGTMTVSLNGTPITPVGVTSGAATTTVISAMNITAGTHVLTVAATVGLSDTMLIVRRGTRVNL